MLAACAAVLSSDMLLLPLFERIMAARLCLLFELSGDWLLCASDVAAYTFALLLLFCQTTPVTVLFASKRNFSSSGRWHW